MRPAQQRGTTADGRPWGHTEPQATAGKPVQPFLLSALIAGGIKVWRQQLIRLNGELFWAQPASSLQAPQAVRDGSGAADHRPREGLGTQPGVAVFRNSQLPVSFAHAGVLF